MGPVFTLHFSTELDFTTGSPQWTFIKDALLSVNRSDTPWVVVGFHRPMYISSTNWAPVGGDQTVAIALRQHVEPLFNNAGGSPVDLVLQGHHHSYQRMCAVWNNGTCYARSAGDNNVYANPGAPVHIVIGTGGAGYSTNVMSPPPPYAGECACWPCVSAAYASMCLCVFATDLHRARLRLALPHAQRWSTSGTGTPE